MRTSAFVNSSDREPIQPLMNTANDGDDDCSDFSPESIVEVAPALVLSIGLILLAAMILLMPLIVADDSVFPGRPSSLFGVPSPISVSKSSETPVSVHSEHKHDQSTIISYPFLRGTLLLEPYLGNVLTVQGIASDGMCLVSWQLRSDSAEPSLVYEGQLEFENTFVVTPEQTGRYILMLHKDCTDDKRPSDMVRSAFEFPVWVKYIRRPLLSLPGEYREEFEGALRTLLETSTQHGQQLYGRDYKGMDFFAEIGAALAADPAIRNGTGNVVGTSNDYALLSSYLEQSLQLVDPRVALHYVDLRQLWNCSSGSAPVSRHASESLTALLHSKWTGSSNELHIATAEDMSGWVDEFVWALAAEDCTPLSGGLLRGSSRSATSAGTQDACRSAMPCYPRPALDFSADGAPVQLNRLPSAALSDPLFWVLLNSLQPLHHACRIGTAALVANRVRGATDLAGVENTAPWLEGFHFEERGVQPEELTHAQLAEVLDPAGAMYRDYFSFVYAMDGLASCTLT